MDCGRMAGKWRDGHPGQVPGASEPREHVSGWGLTHPHASHLRLRMNHHPKWVGVVSQFLNTCLPLLLLLLLSSFSRVRLCATLEMAAHQAPPSPGFSRQDTGVGCHFLLQYMKVKSESEVVQSCPTPSDPMHCSLPGSSAHGIFQTRVLE